MSVGSELLRFSDRKLFLWDFETQRVNVRADNLPFQSSVLIADRKQVHTTIDRYLRWPNYQMSKDAARITRFNPAWVANGEDPEFVLEEFESRALNPDYLLVGHNVLQFDCRVWNLWRRALGRPTLWIEHPDVFLRVIDTHLLSRAWKEGWKPDRSSPMAFWAWQLKVAAGHRKGIKTNLTQMCKDLEIPIDTTRTHDGGYDLGLNVQVYWKLINLMEV